MENEVLLPHAAVPTDEPIKPNAQRAVTDTDPKPSSVDPTVSRADTTAPNALSVDPERTSVFTSLVREDGDIAGLVAYSIYKQNKLDWLQAFELAKGRVPNDAELGSYIIGESTPRRLATYRHLAETTLAGTGPDVPGSPSIPRPSYARDKAGDRPVLSTTIVLYAVIAVLSVVVLWLATHSIFAGR